jgi:hypothetical protein
MLKEFILAIVIGAILGLGITGGYLATQHKNNNSNNNNSIITEPTLIPTLTSQNPSTDIEKKEFINITSPENNSLVFINKTTITGTTTPKSNIVIATSTNTFTGKSDQDGKFEISINLEGGLNIIKISAIDSENNQKDTSINVTYSTAKI